VLQTIPGVRVHRPDATFYLFTNVTGAMARMGHSDVAAFAEAALHNTGVSFCTRRHFGRPLPDETEQYVRFAYSGLSAERITTGLARLRDWIASA
jgi:aspartate/methionine/tyrosine aminotransferase